MLINCSDALSASCFLLKFERCEAFFYVQGVLFTNVRDSQKEDNSKRNQSCLAYARAPTSKSRGFS